MSQRLIRNMFRKVVAMLEARIVIKHIKHHLMYLANESKGVQLFTEEEKVQLTTNC